MIASFITATLLTYENRLWDLCKKTTGTWKPSPIDCYRKSSEEKIFTFEPVCCLSSGRLRRFAVLFAGVFFFSLSPPADFYCSWHKTPRAKARYLSSKRDLTRESSPSGNVRQEGSHIFRAAVWDLSRSNAANITAQRHNNGIIS